MPEPSFPVFQVPYPFLRTLPLQRAEPKRRALSLVVLLGWVHTTSLLVGKATDKLVPSVLCVAV
jgi:hypothetical protein